MKSFFSFVLIVLCTLGSIVLVSAEWGNMWGGQIGRWMQSSENGEWMMKKGQKMEGGMMGSGMQRPKMGSGMQRPKMGSGTMMPRDGMKGGKSQSGTTVLTSEQLTCLRTAVAKRESALMGGVTMMNSTISSAFMTRASALDSAYQVSDKEARKTAVDTAWSTFRSSTETAQKTTQDTQKSTWDIFKTDTKACNVWGADTDGNKPMMMEMAQ